MTESIASAVNDVTPEMTQNDGHQDNNPGETNTAILATGTTDQAIPDTNTEWFYADGVKGEGEVPYDTTKYKSLSEAYASQKKSVEDMRKMVSKLPGAPDDYEFKEDLTEIGLKADDEFIKDFKTLAKENRINQGTFNNLLDFYKQTVDKQQTMLADEIAKFEQTEMAKLGPDAKDIIRKNVTFVHNFFPDDMQEMAQKSLITADNVKVLDFVRQKLANQSNMPVIQDTNGNHEKQMQLQQMMADSRMGKDQDYTQYVENAYKNFYNK